MIWFDVDILQMMISSKWSPDSSKHFANPSIIILSRFKWSSYISLTPTAHRIHSYCEILVCFSKNPSIKSMSSKCNPMNLTNPRNFTLTSSFDIHNITSFHLLIDCPVERSLTWFIRLMSGLDWTGVSHLSLLFGFFSVLLVDSRNSITKHDV